MIKHYTLTMTGSQQNLGAALASQFGSPDVASRPISCISFSAKATNTGVAYYGGSSLLVNSTGCMGRVEAPSSSIPPAPTFFEFSIPRTCLQDWAVTGVNTEILFIGCID